MDICKRKGFRDNYLAPFLAILIIFMSFSGMGQTYNPSLHTVTNKAIGIAQAAPTDARSQYYDPSNFVYRDFNGTTEVLSYLYLPKYRTGHFPIYVHFGGILQSNGAWVGGITQIYWFKNAVSDTSLVLWNTDPSSGCTGCLLAANNLSDVASASTARSNLGLGGMATQSTTAGGDLSGTWPSITVAKFNGQLPSYYLNYLNLTNTPAIPAQINITDAGLFSHTGTYPNLTFFGDTTSFEKSIIKNNALSADRTINQGAFNLIFSGTGAIGIPVGTTAQRPSSPVTGMIRFNTDSLKKETYNGSTWVGDGTGGGGGGSGITALTGDGTASGTGSVPFTLATVNSNIFGSNTFLKFGVNGKGLVTSATTVGSSDIISALGYTPYNSTNPSGYITLTSLSGTSPIVYNNTTGAFSCPTCLQTLTYTQNAANNTLAISNGNSQTFLTATTNLAGLLDTARTRFIDSLKSGLKYDTVNFVNKGAGVRIGWAGHDTLYAGTLLGTTDISWLKNSDSTESASLTTTGVSAGSYTWGNYTVDTKGRISASSSGATGLTNYSDVVFGNGQATSQALIWHQPAVVATNGALSANTYSNGTSGVGATITSNTNLALVVDGYTAAVNDRILVKDEAAPSHNGIYTVTQTGSGSTPFILTRGNYSSVAANMAAMSAIGVQQGAANANKIFVQTTTGTIVFGTTSLVYAQISGGGGSGNTNSNIGSGYRFAVPSTNNIKTLFCVGCTLDSTTNTNALTLTVTGGGSGTVTSVATGLGLSGGPITTSGTLLLDTTYAMTKNTNQVASGVKTFTGAFTASNTVNLSGVTNTTGGASFKVLVQDTANNGKLWNIPYYPFDTTGYAAGNTYAKFNGTTIVLGTAGGGGSQTFPQVLATGRTFSANDSVILGLNSLYFKNGTVKADTVTVNSRLTTDSLYANRMRLHNSATVGDSGYAQQRTAIYQGDSWTAGSNASIFYYSYPYQMSNQENSIPLIYGNPGQSLHGNLTSVYSHIPQFDPSRYTIYVLEYGINDSKTGVTTTQFTADVVAVIDTCLARGWPSSRIIIMSPGFQGTTNNTTTFPFVAAAQSAVTSAGGVFVNGYSYMQNNGGLSLVSSDSIHPTDQGHSIYAKAAMLAISYAVQPAGSMNIHGRLSVGGLYRGPGILSVFNGDPWFNGYYLGTGGANISSNFFITDKRDSVMTGGNNTIIGIGSGGAITSGNSNTGIGRLIFAANTTGSFNTIGGNAAFQSNTTGGNNTSFGWGTLNANVTNNNNTAFGYGALLKSTADNLTAVGYNALSNNTTAIQNVAVGANALLAVTTGATNLGVGFNAAQSGTTFTHVTAVGPSALSGGTGSENTMLGYAAGFSLTTGANNTFIGSQAGYTDGTTATTATISGSFILGYKAQAQASNVGILGGLTTNAVRVGIDMVAPTAYLQLPLSDGIAGKGALKLTDVNITTTAASGTGSSATITFAAQAFPPFQVGSQILVSGVTPSGYNGTFTVTACTTTSVTYLNSTTGSQTVAGIVEGNVLLSTPEAGLFEMNRDSIYWTGRSGTRYTLNRVGAGLTASNGLTLTSGNVALGGTLTSTLTTINTNGNTFGFSGTGLVNFQNSAGVVIASSISEQGWSTTTSGSSATIPSTGYVNVLLNPASLLSTFTYTLPASPLDGQIIKIHFGGTITSGNPVVTTLTISPSGSNVIVQPTTPSTANSGDCLTYKFNAAAPGTWYRESNN